MIAQHEGFIHTGERLVLRVFEQAGRAHGERVRDLREEHLQALLQLRGERSGQELLQNLGIVLALQGEIEQVVLRHELIERIRSQNQSGRHRDADSVKAPADAVFAQEMAHKSQPARLAAQRSGTDPQEARFRGFERIGVEVADDQLALFAAVVVDGFDQVVPQMFRTGKVRDLSRPQLGRQSEFGSRHEPMRKVVALGVIGEAFGRNRLQLFFELIQVLRAAYFFQIGQTKDEVAKTELLGENPAQVFQ